MSYDIFYDKQFVKVSDNIFIPMVYVGSSNCFEYSGRRTRSWSNFSFLLDGAMAGKMSDMREKQCKIRSKYIDNNPTEYNDKNFGYYSALSTNGSGCNMTFGQYEGIVKTGCKKALTVEELLEYNVTINIFSYGDKKTDDKLKGLGLEPLSFTPQTTEELEDFLEGTAPKYMPVTHLHARLAGADEYKMKRIRREKFPLQKKEKKEVMSKIGYTLGFKESPSDKHFLGYAIKNTGANITYGYRSDAGKQYLTGRAAEKVAERYNKKSKFIFEVVEVEYEREQRFYI